MTGPESSEETEPWTSTAAGGGGWAGRGTERRRGGGGGERGKPDGRGDQQLVPSNKFHFQNCSKCVSLLSHPRNTLKYGKKNFKNKDLNIKPTFKRNIQ